MLREAIDWLAVVGKVDRWAMAATFAGVALTFVSGHLIPWLDP